MIGTKSVFGAVILVLFGSASFGKSIGGVGSGGGGVIPPAPIQQLSRGELVEEARHSKEAVSGYFIHALHYPKFSHGPVVQIAQSGQDIQGVLNRIQIIFSSSGCFDTAGNLVDASINIPEPYGICLNMNSLISKLPRSDYRRQLTALIIHEVSHHFGTDEPNAIEIQKDAFYSMDNSAPNDDQTEATLLNQHMGEAAYFASTLRGLQKRLRAGIKTSCFESNLVFAAGSASWANHDWSDDIVSGHQYLESALVARWEGPNWKIVLALNSYVCSMAGRGPSSKQRRDEYLAIYKANPIKFRVESDAADYFDQLIADAEAYRIQVSQFNPLFNVVER